MSGCVDARRSRHGDAEREGSPRRREVGGEVEEGRASEEGSLRTETVPWLSLLSASIRPQEAQEQPYGQCRLTQQNQNHLCARASLSLHLARAVRVAAFFCTGDPSRAPLGDLLGSIAADAPWRTDGTGCTRRGCSRCSSR